MTLLDKIIKMYIRIRCFSHTKDLWKKHLNEKSLEKKQKALRKSLKKKEGEKER